jgi:hypothetical protein
MAEAFFSSGGAFLCAVEAFFSIVGAFFAIIAPQRGSGAPLWGVYAAFISTSEAFCSAHGALNRINGLQSVNISRLDWDINSALGLALIRDDSFSDAIKMAREAMRICQTDFE